jgi:hypothetical protein
LDGTHVLLYIKYIGKRFVNTKREMSNFFYFINMGFFDGAGGGIIGGAMGLIGTGIGAAVAKKQAERQHEYNKEIMALQNQYNQAAAAQQQEYNKEMWDYTNAENQVAHLKNAGLSVGLMYGKGGGGGTSANGASVSGPNAVGGNEVAAGSGYISAGTQMGLGVADILANIKLKESQAESNQADAENKRVDAAKKAGVDTDLARAEEKLATVKADTEKTVQMLNTWNAAEKEKAIELLKTEIEKGNATLRSLLVDAEVNEATKDTLIGQRKADLKNTYETGLKLMAETSRTRQEKKFIEAMEEQGWAKIKQLAREVETGKMNAESAARQAEAFAQSVANKYDIDQQNVTKGYIDMIVEAVTNMFGSLTKVKK